MPESPTLLSLYLDDATYRAEFDHLIAWAAEHGMSTLDLMPGSFWGVWYFEDEPWEYEAIPLGDVHARLHEWGEKYDGRLGDDDLYVRIDSHEFRFCHEADIHVEYEEETALVRHLRTRWRRLGILRE